VRQEVRKGREFFGMIEILDGLREGDVVVAAGGFLLKSDVLREKMGAGCAD
jgi:cobalt-zinc-cadmium efflux system membrane fusion protein